MVVDILDKNFQQIFHLDTFESLIWTERYIGYGEFELLLPLNSEAIQYAEMDNYLKIPGSDRLMIIETLEIDSTFEDGAKFKISGRSLESILTRRIVWNQTKLYGNIQFIINKLLTDNFVNPSIADRKIGNFVINTEIAENSVGDISWQDYIVSEGSIDEQTDDDEDTDILNEKVHVEYTGDNIYDVINELCLVTSIGFKIVVNEKNQFEFSLYRGGNRTYEANEYGKFVIFSPNYNNFSSSNYLNSKAEYKNVTHVLGEGEGTAREQVSLGSANGLERRELYTDARDLQSKLEDGSELTKTVYREGLRQRGKEKLAEVQEIISFEGEIEAERSFLYNEDYFIGDIVKIKNELGMSASVRITEMVRSQDSEGYKLYPTFEVI